LHAGAHCVNVFGKEFVDRRSRFGLFWALNEAPIIALNEPLAVQGIHKGGCIEVGYLTERACDGWNTAKASDHHEAYWSAHAAGELSELRVMELAASWPRSPRSKFEGKLL